MMVYSFLTTFTSIFVLKHLLSLVYKYKIKIGGDHILLTVLISSPVQMSPRPSLASATADFPVPLCCWPSTSGPCVTQLSASFSTWTGGKKASPNR